MTTDFLILVNSIFYGLPSTTKRQKLFWAKIIRVVFPSINEAELQWSESRGASKPLYKVDRINESVKRLPEEEQILLAALLDVFYSHLNETGAENKRSVCQVMDSIKESLVHHKEKITAQYDSLQKLLNQFEARPAIEIPVFIWPLVVDFILRGITLFLFDRGDREGVVTIMMINVIAIPIITIIMAYWVGNSDRKFNQNLLSQSGVLSYSVKFTITLSQYTLTTLFALAGCYITYVLIGGTGAFIIIMALPVYYFIHLRFFSVGRLTAASVHEQLARISSEHEVLDADRNDEEIVKLETKLNSVTSRLEAYVLESALFGALSFSGFLQIMSDNQITFDVLETSAHHVYTATQGIIFGNAEMFTSSLQNINTKENLFGLLSFQSLLCSILFLGVIASRLRFSNVSDRVQYALNLSKAFNQKEEWLIENREATSSARFVEINRKVNLYLQHGSKAMEEVEPVMALMQYLRNAGLLIFLVILISSGFLITPVIAACFIALSFLVLGYFNRSEIQQNMQYAMLQLRASLVRFNVGLMISLLSALVIGFILRIRFQVPATITSKIIGVAILVIIAYVFIWIVLYPHVDKSFGEIGKGSDSQWRSNRWFLIKVPFAFLVVIGIVGLIFKVNGLRGADEQILVGLAGMSMMAFFLGFYLSKPWWTGLVPAFVLSTILTGTLFKILHLSGADEMVNISIVALIITIPVMILLRKRFHKLFLVTFFTILSIIPFLLTGTIDKVGMAYAHQQWPVDRLMLIRDQARIWRYEDLPEVRLTTLKNLVENGEWYTNQYGTRNGFTSLYRRLIENFEEAKSAALDEYKTTNNPEWLITAERGAVLERKILEQFNYTLEEEEIDMEEVLTSEVTLLQASGKQQQLLPVIDAMLQHNSSATLTQQVMNVKKKLKEQP